MTSSNDMSPEVVEIVASDFLSGNGNSDTEITIEYIPTTHDESIPYFAGQDLVQVYIQKRIHLQYCKIDLLF